MNIGIVVLTLVTINFLFVSGRNRIFYCSQTSDEVYIQGEVTGKIITLEKGQTHYAYNKTCVFVIRTTDNRRIKLSVEFSHLHSQPYYSSSACDIYDHVDIRNGENERLISWCGKEYPREIISKDHELNVIFNSNDVNHMDNNYRGVRIKFESFVNSSCPPGWLEFNNSCYSTTLTKQTWDASQRECNVRQSNLFMVEYQGSLKFISSKILNKSTEAFLWTGLNGLVKDEQLQWIDSSSPNAIGEFAVPKWNSKKRCGVISTSLRVMYLEDCHHDTLYALCQSRKNDVTPLYGIPNAYVEYADEDSSGQILLGICIPVIIIIILVIVLYFVKDKLGFTFVCPSFESPHEDIEIEQEADFLPSTSKAVSVDI